MRTVIFLGLLSIADATRENWQNAHTVSTFATVLVVVMVMDIVDFMRKNFS